MYICGNYRARNLRDFKTYTSLCFGQINVYLAHTLTATITESAILNFIGVNLTGMSWFQCLFWWQNETVLISTTHYLTNWMVNAGQSRQCIVIQVTVTLGDVSRFMVHHCVYSMPNHFQFSIILWEHRATWFARANLVQIARLSAESYSQRQVVRMLGVSHECISKISRPHRDTGRPHQCRRGSRRNLTTAWENSSEWSGTIVGRGYRIFDHRNWRHCVFSDESRLTLIHSGACVHMRRRQGERLIDACIQPTLVPSHGMGWHSLWWVKWNGGTGCNPQPTMLHQASQR